MDKHKHSISKYCRLCDKQDDNLKYNVKKFADELNFEYKIDINEDDADSQSTLCCQSCYRGLKESEWKDAVPA